jgi:hypothetical protein
MSNGMHGLRVDGATAHTCKQTAVANAHLC